MNKIVYCIASLLIPGLLGLSLHAQEPQIPPPSPPFLNRMPDHSAWTIVYTPKQAPAIPLAPKISSSSTNAAPVVQQERTLKEVDGVKMEKTRQDVYRWSDKQTTEEWSYNGLFLFKDPGMPDICVLAPSGGSAAIMGAIPDYSKTDFPELAWIGLDNYKAPVTYLQHKCYFFQTQGHGPFPRQAWIDVATKLPVAFDDGTATRVYTIKEVPQRELVLPPAYAEKLKSYQRDWALATGHAIKN